MKILIHAHNFICNIDYFLYTESSRTYDAHVPQPYLASTSRFLKPAQETEPGLLEEMDNFRCEAGNLQNKQGYLVPERLMPAYHLLKQDEGDDQPPNENDFGTKSPNKCKSTLKKIFGTIVYEESKQKRGGEPIGPLRGSTITLKPCYDN